MWNIWRTRRTAKVSRHRRGIGGLWSPAVCGCWLRWHDVSESEDTGDSGMLYPGFRCYSLQPQRAVFLLLIDGDASVICWHNFWRRKHDVMGKVCKTGWLSWIGLLWSRFPAKMIWPISRIFRKPVNGIILISQRPTKTSETSWSIWQKRFLGQTRLTQILTHTGNWPVPKKMDKRIWLWYGHALKGASSALSLCMIYGERCGRRVDHPNCGRGLLASECVMKYISNKKEWNL